MKDCQHRQTCLACSRKEACLSNELRDFLRSLRKKFDTDKELVFYITRFYLKLKCEPMGEIFKVDPSTAWRNAERARENLRKKGNSGERPEGPIER